MKPIRIGVINISDRASAGVYEDLPGKAARELLSSYLTSSWESEYAIIPDDRKRIEQTLIDFADHRGCCLILTTGGTGPDPRDVTPEATESVSEKMMPGFGELMRTTSLQFVPTAILSRQVAGIRGQCLIINLPGKPKAIKECLEAVFPAVPYCVDLIGGPYLETDETVMSSFRPKPR